MKKVFSYILFVMMCSICFLTSVKAYSCKYFLDVTDKNNFKEGETFELNIEFANENEYLIGGKNITSGLVDEYESFPMISYNGKNYYFRTKNFSPFTQYVGDNIAKFGECPTINYNFSKLSSDGKKNLITFTNLGSSQLKNDVNLEEEKVTLYTISFGQCSLNFPKSTCKDKTVSVNFYALSNGKYEIELNSNGKKLASEDSNDENHIVWTDTYSGKVLKIRQKEWEEIKNSMKFDPNSTTGKASAKVTEIAGKEYVISINDITDGVSKSIEASSDYTYKVIDKIINSETGFCVDYLGSADEPDTVASYLQTAYTLIKIGSIILVVVFSMLDFASAITSDKTDVKMTAMKWVKRLVAVLIILLLPTFIDMIGNILNIEDILCGIK